MPELRPPAAVMRIARKLKSAGHETWAVGGAIRDALAGEPLGDWDLATGAHPGEVRRIFRRTIPIGIEHGTVGVLAENGTLYELTTFRRDVLTDGRRAEVEFADRIEDDLSRRDFTINAVAWNPLTGEWLDPAGGAADLEAGVLRTVGDPTERFREDWLRVLRALRFAGRFELTIEADTWDAICAAGDALLSLSAERVREELVKVLGARRPSGSLDLYARSGVLRTLLPEIAPASDDQMLRFDRRLEVIDEILPEPVEGRMAVLFGLAVAESYDEEAEIAVVVEMMRRLRCSNVETERVGELIRATLGSRPPTEEVEARRWLSRWGGDLLEPAARIWSAEAHVEVADSGAVAEGIDRMRRVARSGVALSVSDLAIDGHELQRMGLPTGPQYGELLRRLLERVLEEPALNEPDSLRALVREWTEVP